MSAADDREPAREPEDLGRLFLARANAGDVDGVVALYEAGAVLVNPAGGPVSGAAAIRDAYVQLLAGGPKFRGDVRPAVTVGELALTSTQFELASTGADGQPARSATAEVARRQPDGTWKWLIDKPNVLAR